MALLHRFYYTVKQVFFPFGSYVSNFSAASTREPSDLHIDGSDILAQGLQGLQAIPDLAAMLPGQGVSGAPQELIDLLQKAVEEKKDKETVMVELKAVREAMIKHTG